MIELMIAMGVLLVATLAAFGSQVTSYQVIDSSRDHSIAMSDLELAMEEVLAVSIDNMTGDTGAFPEGTSIAGFDDLHLRGQRITPSYPNYAGAGPVPDPLEIRLTATWLDARRRPQRSFLTTVKTR